MSEHDRQGRAGHSVEDVVFDFGVKQRLVSSRGNAMLVASSIYEACRYFELFQKTPLRGRCPRAAPAKRCRREPRHDARFVALMDSLLPSWRSVRQALNRLPVRHEAWGY